MTITTLGGYGELKLSSDSTKLFTVFLAWVGISIALFALNALSEAREKVVDPGLLQRLRELKNIAYIRTGKKAWPEPDEPDVQVSKAEIKKRYRNGIKL
jgi:hypothetical protein